MINTLFGRRIWVDFPRIIIPVPAKGTQVINSGGGEEGFRPQEGEDCLSTIRFDTNIIPNWRTAAAAFVLYNRRSA